MSRGIGSTSPRSRYKNRAKVARKLNGLSLCYESVMGNLSSTFELLQGSALWRSQRGELSPPPDPPEFPSSFLPQSSIYRRGKPVT